MSQDSEPQAMLTENGRPIEALQLDLWAGLPGDLRIVRLDRTYQNAEAYVRSIGHAIIGMPDTLAAEPVPVEAMRQNVLGEKVTTFALLNEADVIMGGITLEQVAPNPKHGIPLETIGIRALYRLPTVGGVGAGEKLFAYGLYRAYTGGASNVRLAVLSDNRVAGQLYWRAGFRPYGVSENRSLVYMKVSRKQLKEALHLNLGYGLDQL